MSFVCRWRDEYIYLIVGLALIGFGEKTIANTKLFNLTVGFAILGYAIFILLT